MVFLLVLLVLSIFSLRIHDFHSLADMLFSKRRLSASCETLCVHPVNALSQSSGVQIHAEHGCRGYTGHSPPAPETLYGIYVDMSIIKLSGYGAIVIGANFRKPQKDFLCRNVPKRALQIFVVMVRNRNSRGGCQFDKVSM